MIIGKSVHDRKMNDFQYFPNGDLSPTDMSCDSDTSTSSFINLSINQSGSSYGNFYSSSPASSSSSSSTTVNATIKNNNLTAFKQDQFSALSESSILSPTSTSLNSYTETLINKQKLNQVNFFLPLILFSRDCFNKSLSGPFKSLFFYCLKKDR